VLKIWC